MLRFVSLRKAFCLVLVLAEIVNCVPAPPLSHEYNITIINYSSKLKKPTNQTVRCSTNEVEIPEEPSAEVTTAAPSKGTTASGSKEDDSNSILADVKQYMDSSVDPCEDFYEYACGNFGERDKEASLWPMYDLRFIAKEAIQSDLEKLLHDEEESENEHEENDESSKNGDDDEDDSGFEKVKQLYKTCTNWDQRKEQGVQPLLDFIESLGGWHLLNGEWDEDDFDWVRVVGKLSTYNIEVLINNHMSHDEKDPGTKTINIYAPFQYEFSYPDLDNEVLADAYTKYVTTMLEKLGIDEEVAGETAEEITEFSKKLSELSTENSNEDDEEDLDDELTLKELQKAIPGIDWRQYFYLTFGKRISSKQNVKISNKRSIYNLPDLISKTEAKVLANYIFVKVAHMSLPYLDDRFAEARLEYWHSVTGGKTMEQPEQEIIDFLISNFHATITAKYIETYDHVEHKDAIDEIVESIKEAIEDMVTDNEWLDKQTKADIKKKISELYVQIAYSDMLPSEEARKKEATDLDFDEDKCFENVLKLNKHKAKLERSYLDDQIDEWNVPSLTDPAFYVTPLNQIYLTLSSLKYPYYDPSLPKSFLFGTIGQQIARLMMQSVSGCGSNYNAYGQKAELWSKESLEVLEGHEECYIDQYNQYEVFDQHIHGNRTAVRNIQDSESLRIAYNAYHKWLSKNEEHTDEQTIDNLDLTDEQLLFLASAYQTCGVMTPEMTILGVKGGYVVPNRFRVIGSVSNSEEFADAYNCPKESPMNPTEKCQIL